MGLESEDLNLNPSPCLPVVEPESGVIVYEVETLVPALLGCRVPTDTILWSIKRGHSTEPKVARI